MTYSLHRGAELDLLEAAQFYRREGGVMLANRSLSEFERVVELLLEHPGIGTPADELRRVHPLHEFPYSVIYREIDGRLRILVVRAHHRDPDHGELRR
jgi:plasmid stabilization system protein ParE